jgi:hypothetical protein
MSGERGGQSLLIHLPGNVLSRNARTCRPQWGEGHRSEAIVEHYNWAPHVEATYLCTTLQDQASSVLHGDPKGATYEETVRSFEDWFGGQHLTAGYRDQLKTGTQILSESLEEFAIATEQVTHHAFPAWHEDHLCRGPGKAFGNSIGNLGIKQQLLGKQEDTQRGPQADPRAGSHKANSWFFHRALENEWQGIEEELAPSQTRKRSPVAYMLAL